MALTVRRSLEGMPWVRAEPPSQLKDVVHSLIPAAEIWAGANDEPPEQELRRALNWAAEGQRTSDDGSVAEGLVVVAGSLYLVADFYRLLGAADRSNNR